MFKDRLDKGIPRVIDRRQRLFTDKLSSERLFRAPDFTQFAYFGHKHVGPTYFCPFRHPVATQILDSVEHRPGFFDGFAPSGIEGAFKRLNAAAGNTPAAVFDVAQQNLFVMPAKNQRGEGSQRRLEGSGEEFQPLPSVFSCRKFAHKRSLYS